MIAERNFALGDTSVGEAWKPMTAIGMDHYSKQDLVVPVGVFEPDPWGHRMATAGHENRTVEVPRLEAPDKGALLAAAAAASIVLETKGLGVHQKPSVDPDNGRLPYDCRPVEVWGVAAVVHDRCNIPGRGEEAVGDACQRQTTLYVSFLGQALAGRRTMSWFGTSPEGGQRQRCLRTRHLVDSYHSGRGSPAGVGQQPGSYTDSRPCLLRCRRDEISQTAGTRESQGEGRQTKSGVKRRASC